MQNGEGPLLWYGIVSMLAAVQPHMPRLICTFVNPIEFFSWSIGSTTDCKKRTAFVYTNGAMYHSSEVFVPTWECWVDKG